MTDAAGFRQHPSPNTHIMLAKLPNLGPKSAQMLQKAGITTEEQLRAMGSVAAYHAVMRAGARPNHNLLWALEGALTGNHWQEIARTRRHQLLLELDDMKSRNR